VLALVSQAALAATIYVMSIGRSDVQLIVDGTTVRSMRVGDVSPEGIRLVEVRAGAAVFEVGGKQVILGLGQSTVAQTMLRADARGHFMVNALVNGVPVQAIIDTGATNVALNMADARRMGIDLRGARRVTSQTANGPATAYLVPLHSVQVGDIVLRNVIGEIIDGGPEKLPIALIGMSFLKQVEMRRTGNAMTLSRPHLR